jgi:hypothetical protein
MFIDRQQPQPAPRTARASWRGAAMAVRCVTALVGGYAAAAAIATLIARLLPVDRAEATAWGLVSAFLFYAAIGLWCFHERRLARVAAIVWGIAVAGGGLLWLLGVRP